LPVLVTLDTNQPGEEVALEMKAYPGSKMLDQLKANNRAWAEGKVADDTAFFSRHENHQSPEYLWIGCSDSRVPANEIVGLAPGELFVHRNVANQAPPSDINYRSVLQYAVTELKVKHILVVGHYGCGGVAASLQDGLSGPVDQWIDPIREVYKQHRADLDKVEDEKERLNRLCELNVMRQVQNVASDKYVRDAWEHGQEINVHGWVYNLGDGLVTDLDVTVSHSS
tara:strand:- start:181 stop:858 length:678 start_codon:yes stop_codon:yes gene_type:complete